MALVESKVPLSISALSGVLQARFKQEKIDNYRNELIYLLVKTRYENVISPNEFVNNLYRSKKREDSAETIINKLIKKLRG